MKRLLILALLLFICAAPVVFAQEIGQSCDAGGGKAGVMTNQGCVAAPPETSAPSTLAPTGGAAPTGSNFKAIAPIPGLTGEGATSVVNSRVLADFFNNLYKYLIGIAAVAAVIQITVHGIRIALNQDNVSKLLDSKGKVYNALYGLLLVLAPVLVFSLINPSILNLSLNIPSLDTANTFNLPAGTHNPTLDTETKCSVVGKAGLLEIAECPSPAAAQQWAAKCTGPVSAIKTPDEVAAKSTVACSRNNGFVFINALSSLLVGKINEYRPLAVTSENASNGQDAMEFAGICKSAGRATCVATALTAGYIDCDPKPVTPVAKSGSGLCFKEQLVCQPASIVTTLNTNCDTSPSWTIFN